MVSYIAVQGDLFGPENDEPSDYGYWDFDYWGIDTTKHPKVIENKGFAETLLNQTHIYRIPVCEISYGFEYPFGNRTGIIELLCSPKPKK